MEDKNKMSAEQAERVVTWLDKTWTGIRKCPICKSDQWHVAEHFVTPIVLSPDGGLSFGGVAYPHMIVTSTPCGYSMLINAVIAGVYEQTDGGENV